MAAICARERSLPVRMTGAPELGRMSSSGGSEREDIQVRVELVDVLNVLGNERGHFLLGKSRVDPARFYALQKVRPLNWNSPVLSKNII